MKVLEWLFGESDASRRATSVQIATEALKRSSERLEHKLNEDRCASDPTRQECAPDVADILLAARFRRDHRAP